MATLCKQKNSKHWYVVWRQGGKQHWKSVGTDDTEKAKSVLAGVQALIDGRQREDQLRALLELVRAPVLPDTRVPVATLWELYDRQPKPRRMSPATARTKQLHIRHWLQWMQEHHPATVYLHEVSEQIGAEYFAAEEQAGVAGQTRNNRLSCLHDVFRVIRVVADLKRNIWDAIPRVQANNQRHEALSLKQVQDLYAKALAFEAKVPTFWPAAIALGWHTGLRFGDVCTLEWREIMLDENQIKLIPNKTQKQDRPQVYVLHPDYLKWIEKAGEKWGRAGYVWPPIAEAYMKDAKHNPTWLFHEFDAICEKCEIQTSRDATPGRKHRVKVISFHSLRHSFVTELLDRGEDLGTVQQAVGHGSPAMTTHYSHSLAAGKRASELLPGLQKKRARRPQHAAIATPPASDTRAEPVPPRTAARPPHRTGSRSLRSESP